MTAPLSLQLYALDAAPAADPSGVIARLAALGYEAVELSIRPFRTQLVGGRSSDLPNMDFHALAGQGCRVSGYCPLHL